MTQNTSESVQEKWDSLSLFGKVLIQLKIVRAYHNGDTVGFVWRFWNPLSWMCIPVYILVYILIDGISKLTLSECLFTVEPFFKTHPFEWVDWGKRH
jgi:hypothetical protein